MKDCMYFSFNSYSFKFLDTIIIENNHNDIVILYFYYVYWMAIFNL